MDRLTVNGHIAYLQKRSDKIKRTAESEPGFDQIRAEFGTYADKIFLTQYCQERLIMSNRFHYELIPAKHYGLEEENVESKEKTV